MEVTELNIKIDLKGSGVPRSKGVHLTDIRNHILKATGQMPDSDWNLELAGEVGFIWENVLSKVLGERLGTRPGEFSSAEGIIISPDGIGVHPLNDDLLVLEEYKVTWASINTKKIEEYWPWEFQTKSYCHVLNLKDVIYHILYLMGDYRGSGPMMKSYHIEYMEEEIEENWENIVIPNWKEMTGW